MFFEGSEKKLEVIVGADTGSLRSFANEFWVQLVAACQAKILSKISSESCDAYLLSESSLFVWDEQFTLITCGKTNLVNSAEFFLKNFKPNDIQSLIYERKNEYFPQMQETDFYSDARKLKGMVGGQALRFGPADEHHLYMFHMDKAYEPNVEDSTFEMLMYSVDKSFIEIFRNRNLSESEARDVLKLNQLFPGFTLDDHVFDPQGYSVNGLREKDYFTIHVTPQELGQFISFESNLHLKEGYQPLLERLLEVFRPKSFDIVNFQPEDCKALNVSGYVRRSIFKKNLICGYGVVYSHFLQPQLELQQAFDIRL